MRILTIILYTYAQQNENTYVIGFFHACEKYKRSPIHILLLSKKIDFII